MKQHAKDTAPCLAKVGVEGSNPFARSRFPACPKPLRLPREPLYHAAPDPTSSALAVWRMPAVDRAGDPASGTAAARRPASVGNRYRLAREPAADAVCD